MGICFEGLAAGGLHVVANSGLGEMPFSAHQADCGSLRDPVDQVVAMSMRIYNSILSLP